MTDLHSLFHAYTHLREHLVALHMHLFHRLPPRVVKDARRKLGLHKARLAEAAEETATVALVDYALYHYRPGGRTLLEAHFEEHPPEPGSHDDQLRQALASYRYTIFEVVEVEDDFGLEVHDVLLDQPFFLLDRGLSRSSDEGMRFAAGVLWLPEYAMTTGAVLPLDDDVFDRIERELTLRFGDLAALDVEALRPAEQAELAALILRQALRGGAAASIAYR